MSASAAYTPEASLDESSQIRPPVHRRHPRRLGQTHFQLLRPAVLATIASQLETVEPLWQKVETMSLSQDACRTSCYSISTSSSVVEASVIPPNQPQQHAFSSTVISEDNNLESPSTSPPLKRCRRVSVSGASPLEQEDEALNDDGSSTWLPNTTKRRVSIYHTDC
jgi:hypothetical protein